MNEITSDAIKALAEDKSNIEMSSHANSRCIKRIICSKDILNVLRNGEVIEQYPDDYPYPSCLELGLSISGKPLHVRCAISNDKLWVITAYYPTTDKWNNDMKTRKAAK